MTTTHERETQLRAPRDLRPSRPEPLTVKRQTCEGCRFLTRERPRCASEDSPHFRQPRESYHDRCARFAAPGVRQEVSA